MAYTRSTTYVVTLTFQDRDNNKATTQFYTSTANLVLEVITAIEATIIPTIAALSDAVIIGWTISSAAEDLAPVIAPETSDVERKAVFSFRAENGASYVIQVPSVKNTLVVDGTNVLDVNNAVVAAFRDMVVSDAILALIRPRTYLGGDITQLQRTPYKMHRASRRG